LSVWIGMKVRSHSAMRKYETIQSAPELEILIRMKHH